MNAVATVEGRSPLDAAILKAVGLDRVPQEQRVLALNIAERYGLDLMLKHLIMVEGRPYLTRDGLLHIAHRSGQFDGIECSVPEEREGFWHCVCTVFRKDMTRGFTYAGRYPVKGRNQAYAPEMAVARAESMALRRAFDVSAPTIDERWDLDEQASAPPPRPVASLADKVKARRTVIEERANDEPVPPPPAPGEVEPAGSAPSPGTDEPESTPVQGEAVAASDPAAAASPMTRCDELSPYEGHEQCRRESGHPGNHRSSSKESW